VEKKVSVAFPRLDEEVKATFDMIREDNEFSGTSSLDDILQEASERGAKAVIRLLLESGADLNTTNELGQWKLTLAAMKWVHGSG